MGIGAVATGEHKLEFQREEPFVPPVWPTVAGEQQVGMHLDIAVHGLAPMSAMEHRRAQFGEMAERAVSLGARVADTSPSRSAWLYCSIPPATRSASSLAPETRRAPTRWGGGCARKRRSQRSRRPGAPRYEAHVMCPGEDAWRTSWVGNGARGPSESVIPRRVIRRASCQSCGI